ncbi:MAG: tRNA pseudouridine(55) synthase TruB [Chitinivibrionales bacterium]|nr:tRNA pseudouridine(55) synthase TruB [Chitinivibrionales bacterium]MBD3395495.1 tRNA pseudouridine(55) synthase TruB [Chitinivibrionales bacterium]
MEGILCIDKPAGPSSMAAIARVKKTLGSAKVGHSGTLDPHATGLLIVALGNATRVLPYLELEPKRYEFTLVFGTATDTLDAAGAVFEKGLRIPSQSEIVEALAVFRGSIRQVPPRFSALKVKGTRAYKLAKQGRDFSPPPRTVTIHSLTLQTYDEAVGRGVFSVSCSSGTYVRSLARDIAEKCGTAGHAGSIRRTSMGPFNVDAAVSCNAERGDLESHMLPLYQVLAEQPAHIASREELMQLAHGRDIEVSDMPAPFLFVFTESRELAAVAQRVGDTTFHPSKVFARI